MSAPEYVILGWKNEQYRVNLSEANRTALPPNPAGCVDSSAIDDLLAPDEALAGSFSCTRSRGGGCSCNCSPPKLTTATPSGES